ncbi:MAG: hypothetical protein M3198_17950 [Actinomycetota bacterium]|nr:hypothetical protein [Actinomycetota bacterium]
MRPEHVALRGVRFRMVGAGPLADGLVHEVVEFQDGRPRDDIAVAVLKVPSPRT